MQSFLTNTQKDTYGNMFYNLHATFERPITIFKTAERVVVQTNEENNYLFQQAPFNSEVEHIIQSGVFGARILYGKKENLSPFKTEYRNGAGEQNVIRLSEGEVRIKLDPTGAAYLDGCDRITFDGTIFNVVTDPRPHGLFDPKFKDFYLKIIK